MNEPPLPDDSTPKPLGLRLSLLVDGQLSDAERESLERELRSDPDAQALLGDMRKRREVMRQMFLETAGGLPPGFADRVIDAAIERAQREGLGEDHPLILAAEQPSEPTFAPSSMVARSNVRRNRTAAIAATVLAASVGGVMWFLGGSVPIDIAQAPVADHGAMTTPADAASDGVDDVEGFEGFEKITASEQDLAASSPANGRENDLAQTDGPSQTNNPSQTNATVVDGIAAKVDVSRRFDDGPLPATNGLATNGLAAVDGSQAASRPVDSQPPSLLTGAVMVYEVVCNDSSTRDMVLADAMRSAGLRLESQQRISDGLVTAATEASGVDERANFQILYLSASAKRIDRLYFELLRDRQYVRSVGLSVAFSAPIVAAVEALSKASPSGRSATGDGAVFPVAIEDDTRALVENLNELTFMPISAGDGPNSGGGQMGASLGGDEIAQAILIVR